MESRPVSPTYARLPKLLYTAELCTKSKQIRCCHLMLNSPATRWYLGFHFLLINEAMQGKTFRWRCWPVRPALQTNSSNCLMLIPHRQFGIYLHSGESNGLTAQHMQDLLYRVLVPLHSSNVGGKIVSSWCGNFGPSPACSMDTRETLAAKVAKPAGDICALAT